MFFLNGLLKSCVILFFRYVQDKKTHNIFCLKSKIRILQVQSAQTIKEKRTSQSSLCGSMTVEASLVFPIFLFVFYAFLMLGQLLMTDDEVAKALLQTARYLAKEEYSIYEDKRSKVEEGEAEKRVGLESGVNLPLKLRFLQYLDKDRLKLVYGNIMGIRLKRHENSEDMVVLTANLVCEIQLPFIGKYQIPLKERVSQRIFSGYDGNGAFEREDYVYVAKHGDVYHLNPDCSYISVRVVAADSLDALGKQKCHLCDDNAANGKYVTICGNKVHQDINCSSLTRTIRLVSKKELDGLPLCSRCAAGR